LQSIRARFIVVSVIAIVIATYISDQLLYKLLIIPKLAEWKQIPFPWWTIQYLPFVLTVCVVSSRIKSFKEFITLSIFVTLASNVYGQIAAWLYFRGHLKSFAIEDPFYFWTVGMLHVLIFFGIVFGLCKLCCLACSVLTRKILNACQSHS
jgi:hypothetical protein